LGVGMNPEEKIAIDLAARPPDRNFDIATTTVTIANATLTLLSNEK
jgi:hypothetical protein